MKKRYIPLTAAEAAEVLWEENAWRGVMDVADSLDIVELIMALEEEFGTEIPDEEAEKLQTVGDVAKFIEDTQG